MKGERTERRRNEGREIVVMSINLPSICSSRVWSVPPLDYLSRRGWTQS